MNEKKILYFWIGFLISTVATIWLYLVIRKNRVITPGPLVISRYETNQRETLNEAGVIEKPDNLEAINGIGPATARLLNDSGIYSYKQVAVTSPEKLREISGTSRWDPAEWIAQARELSVDS